MIFLKKCNVHLQQTLLCFRAFLPGAVLFPFWKWALFTRHPYLGTWSANGQLIGLHRSGCELTVRIWCNCRSKATLGLLWNRVQILKIRCNVRAPEGIDYWIHRELGGTPPRKLSYSPPSYFLDRFFCKRFQWHVLTFHLSLIAVRPFVSKKKGSDEELMTHSEDEHEVDVVANKG